MSTPALGPKKVRKLGELCGLSLNGAWSGNGREAHVRTRDHHHYTVDRRTGEILSEHPGSCFTDCPPAVDDWGRGIKGFDPADWDESVVR